jgi:hypothetical protein
LGREGTKGKAERKDWRDIVGGGVDREYEEEDVLEDDSRLNASSCVDGWVWMDGCGWMRLS